MNYINDTKLLTPGNIIFLFFALFSVITGNSIFIMLIFLYAFIIMILHTYNLEIESLALYIVLGIIFMPLVYLIFNYFFLILIFPILAIYFISIFKLWNK